MFVINGRAQEFTSLTFVVRSSSCGVNPLYNATTIRSQWYDNGNGAQYVSTLQRFYSVSSVLHTSLTQLLVYSYLPPRAQSGAPDNSVTLGSTASHRFSSEVLNE